jgi:cold shock CspA family protein
MGKSQETFGKKDREKKRAQKRKVKEQKREERKESNLKGAGLDSMITYVDEFGLPTDTPPDPSKRIKIDASTIEIGVARRTDEEEADPIKQGRVSFFNGSKGYGFITETGSQEKYFYHVNGTLEAIIEGDKVSFELERGPKGWQATQVKKA